MAGLFEKINWIDLLIVILLIRSSYVGFTRGFSWEFFRFVGLACAVIVPIYFYEYLSQLMSDYFPIIYPIASLLGFTSLYIIILVISKIIIHLIEKVIKIEVLSTVERLGGLFFGFIRGNLLLSLLLISLMFVPIPYFEKSIKERSYTGKTVSQVAPFLYEKLAMIFPGLKFGLRNESLIILTGLGENPSFTKGAKTNVKDYKKGSLRGGIE